MRKALLLLVLLFVTVFCAGTVFADSSCDYLNVSDKIMADDIPITSYPWNDGNGNSNNGNNNEESKKGCNSGAAAAIVFTVAALGLSIKKK